MAEPSSVKKYGIVTHVSSKSKVSKEKRSYSILSEVPKDFHQYEKVLTLDRYLTLVGGKGYKSHRSIVKKQIIRLVDEGRIIMLGKFVVSTDPADDGYLIYSRK